MGFRPLVSGEDAQPTQRRGFIPISDSALPAADAEFSAADTAFPVANAAADVGARVRGRAAPRVITGEEPSISGFLRSLLPAPRTSVMAPPPALPSMGGEAVVPDQLGPATPRLPPSMGPAKAPLIPFGQASTLDAVKAVPEAIDAGATRMALEVGRAVEIAKNAPRATAAALGLAREPGQAAALAYEPLLRDQSLADLKLRAKTMAGGEDSSIVSAAMSVPQSAAMMLGYAAGGVPGTMLAMQPQTVDDYKKYRNLGADEITAFFAAQGNALAEGAPEGIGWHFLTKLFRLPAGATKRQFLRAVGVQQVGEHAEEQITNMAKYVIGRAMNDPNATPDKLWEDVKQTFGTTAILAPAFGATAIAARGVPYIADAAMDKLSPNTAIARELSRILNETDPSAEGLGRGNSLTIPGNVTPPPLPPSAVIPRPGAPAAPALSTKPAATPAEIIGPAEAVKLDEAAQARVGNDAAIRTFSEKAGEEIGGVSHLKGIVESLQETYIKNGPEAGRAKLEGMAKNAPESSGFPLEVATPGFIDELDAELSKRARQFLGGIKPAAGKPLDDQAADQGGAPFDAEQLLTPEQRLEFALRTMTERGRVGEDLGLPLPVIDPEFSGKAPSKRRLFGDFPQIVLPSAAAPDRAEASAGNDAELSAEEQAAIQSELEAEMRGPASRKGRLRKEDIPPLASRAPRISLFPNLLGGLSPVHSFVSEEDAVGRLSRTLVRDQASLAQPKNRRTVLKDAMGEFVVGRITPDDWLKRVEANIPKEEFASARGWYRQLHDLLTPLYGEEAPKVALAWLLSQQRASPSKGMQDVLRAMDNIRGKSTKTAGLNSEALKAALRGEVPKGGLGAKLLDFVDAEMGLRSRTVMGRDERGGQPAPYDVWGNRDSGLVDAPMMNKLRARFGKQADKLAEDPFNNSSEAFYERGSKFYNDLKDHLNKIGYDGGNWTAPEVQAVGWVAIQKALGEKPEYVSDIVGMNTRRVSLGLAPGKGSSLTADHPLFKPERAIEVIQQLADLAGVKILKAKEGQGAYESDVEGAIQIDAFASQEDVHDFMDMLGYTFQQSEVIAHRSMLSGNRGAIDIVFDGGSAGREMEFFQKLREFTADKDKGVDLTPGYQQINIDGKAGIRIMNFSGKLDNDKGEHITTAAALAANDLGITLSDVVTFNISLEHTRNDWTKNPGGEQYQAALRKRGRLQEAAGMDRISRAAQGRDAEPRASRSAEGTDAQEGLTKSDKSEKTDKTDKTGETDKISVVRFRTGSGHTYGMRGINTRKAIRPLSGPRAELVKSVLEMLVEGRSLSAELVNDITGYSEFEDWFESASALYFPSSGVIALRRTYIEETASGGQAGLNTLARTIAHEITHHVDFADGGPDTFSGDSARLDYAMINNGDSIEMKGDLAIEIGQAMGKYASMRKYFTYPIAYIFDGSMAPEDAKAELTAQVGGLYAAHPEFVRRTMPKWYSIMEDVYVGSQESQGQESDGSAISRARSRLQKALQNETADKRVSGGVGGQYLAQRTAVPSQPGAPRGPPGPAVGGRTQVGAGNAGGGSTGGKTSGRAAGGPFWDIDERGLRDDLIREWQDNRIDLLRTQESILRAGGVIREKNNAYLVEELYGDRVTAKLKKFADVIVKPLLKQISESGLTIEQVGKYLWARHAPERNKQMARINPSGELNLSGLFDNARVAAAAGQSGAPNAADIISGFSAKERAALNSIAAKIDSITKSTRDIIVNEHLEHPDVIKSWEGAYKHYVPLFRDVDEPVAGQGFQVSGPESRRAMGSTNEAVGIVAAVIAQHERVIMRAEKADVARSLVRLAEDFPKPDFWRVDQPPTKRTINQSTGLVQVGTDPMYRQRDDVLIVKMKDANGDIVERVLSFNPKNERAMHLAAAMRNLDVVQLGAFTKAVGQVTRVMANLATSWNPLFWTTNFVRDVQTMAVNLQSTPLKGQAPKVIASIMPAMYGIASAEFRNGTGKWATLYREFEEEGGKTGWMTVFDDLLDRQRELEKLINSAKRSNANPIKWATTAMDTVETVNTMVENSTRLAAYAVARDHGLSQKQAASLAKNLTVNFKRKGNRSSAINSWYMFFNANVQGNMRMLHAVMKSRRARIMVGVMVAFSAALELMNRIIGDRDRDEDGNNTYEIIPEHIRQRNLVVMLGGDRRVTIPMPYGFNIFHNAGRMMMEVVLGASGSGLVDEKRDPIELAWSYMQVLVDAFMPIGQSTTPAQLISPTVMDPVIQYSENKTWYGGPLRPEPSSFGAQKPSHQQYFRSTSETAKSLTKFLSDATGGDEVRGGSIDISPTTVVHVLRTVTGGVGSFGLGMFDFTDHSIGRITGDRIPEDLPWKNVPFVGKFYGEIDDRDVASKYYRLRERAAAVFSQYERYRKIGDTDGMEKIVRESPALLEMGRTINSKMFRREMSSLRNEINAASELTGIERERAKRALREEERIVMGHALSAYNQAVMEAR